MISLYTPGTSLIHRMYAWVKLALLCLSGTTVMFVTAPLILGIANLVIVVLYIVARIPARVIWRVSRSVIIVIAIIVGFQWFFSSASFALIVGGRILFLIAAANLLTLTTSMSDLVAVVETILGPLTRFGCRPERAGIAIGLALRFIPVLVEQGALIREAQRARGVRAPFTYLVPLIIRTIAMADAVGEALEVRSMLAGGAGKLNSVQEGI